MQMYLDSIVDAVGCGKYQYMMLLISGLAFISDAMEITLITFIIKEIKADFHCSDFLVSLLASTIFFGMFMGSVVMGPLSDYIGRRHTFFVCMLFVSIGGLLSSLSSSLKLFMLTRAFVGVGVGGLHVSVTIFTEFIPRKQRAFMITLLQVFWSIGTVLEVALAWALRDASWQTLVLFTAFPSVLSALSYFCFSESPIYLYSNKRFSEAMLIFERVARRNSTMDSFNAVPLPESCAELQEAPTKSFKEKIALIFSQQLYRTTFLCFIILWFVGSFNYCGSLFFSADLNYGQWNRFVSMLLISIGEILGKPLAYVFLAHWQRKSSIYICLASSFLGSVIISLQHVMPGTLTFLGIFLFRTSISMYLTVLSLYTPECFPTEIRSSGFGISSAGSRVGGMLTPFIAIMVKSVHHTLSIGIFALSLVLAVIATYILPFDSYNISLNRNAGDEVNHDRRTL